MGASNSSPVAGFLLMDFDTETKKAGDPSQLYWFDIQLKKGSPLP